MESQQKTSDTSVPGKIYKNRFLIVTSMAAMLALYFLRSFTYQVIVYDSSTEREHEASDYMDASDSAKSSTSDVIHDVTNANNKEHETTTIISTTISENSDTITSTDVIVSDDSESETSIPLSGETRIIYNENVLYQFIKNIHTNHLLTPPGEKCRQRKLGALIVGVAKSGTRELLDFLSMHPGVVIYRKNGHYQMGTQKFKKHTANETLAKMMPCSYSNQIGVAKADAYFAKDWMAKRLYELNPRMKIIAILREPISRLISHIMYIYFIKHRHNNISYSQIMKDLDINAKLREALENENSSAFDKFRLSEYDTSLKYYQDVFPRDQILIVNADDFKSNPAAVIDKVASYLGLKDFSAEDYFVYNKYKHFYCVRNPDTDEEMACYADNRGHADPVIIQDDIKQELITRFAPHTKRFYKLLGEKYDWKYQ